MVHERGGLKDGSWHLYSNINPAKQEAIDEKKKRIVADDKFKYVSKQVTDFGNRMWSANTNDEKSIRASDHKY